MKLRRALSCLLLCLILSAALGQTRPSAASTMPAPHLLKDINLCTESAAPILLAQTADEVFLLAQQTGVGQSLWRSDGTPGGTRMIKLLSAVSDLLPVSSGVWLGNRFYFFTSSSSQPDYSLWTSDGTPDQTREITRLVSGLEYPMISLPVVLNGTLYFFISSWSTDPDTFELWRSDGTSAGTRIAAQGALPNYGYSPVEMVVYGGYLYFSAWDAEHGTELWRSDGTQQGTGLFADLNPGSSSDPAHLYAGSGSLYFTARHASGTWAVWKSDGTPAGTHPVLSDRYTGAVGQLIERNNILYFNGYTPTGGLRLFRTDGTPEGTWMVKYVNRQPIGKFEPKLVRVGDTLYFIANETELWRSDGTEAGTVMVKPLFTPRDEADLWNVVDLGGVFYFSTQSVGNPSQLWRSDGTGEGTQRVETDNPNDPLYINSGPMLIQGNRLILSGGGYKSCVGGELMRVDEPPAASPPRAALVLDIAARTNGSGFEYPVSYKGRTYFSAWDGQTYHQLWTSDGTESGTHMVKEINWVKPGAGGLVFGFEAAGAGDWLFFTAADETGLQLWRTDGTADATIRLTDVKANYPLDGPHGLAALGDQMVFFDNATGAETLWVSDGSPSGTRPVLAFEAGDRAAGGPVELGGALYLLVGSPSGRTRLYRTDGTTAGTVVIQEWAVAPGGVSLVRAGGWLYFPAGDSVHGLELWQTDGTPQGTHLYGDLTPGPASTNFRFIQPIGKGAGDGVILVTGNEDVWTVWRAGEDAGAFAPLLYAGRPRVGNPIDALKSGGGWVYFTVQLDRGSVLWRTDGTQAGTLALTASVGEFIPVGNWVFFTAWDSAHGSELWASRGTPGSIQRIADLWPGPQSSNPGTFYYASGKLWFAADDALHGREPWVYDFLSQRYFLPAVQH